MNTLESVMSLYFQEKGIVPVINKVKKLKKSLDELETTSKGITSISQAIAKTNAKGQSNMGRMQFAESWSQAIPKIKEVKTSINSISDAIASTKFTNPLNNAEFAEIWNKSIPKFKKSFDELSALPKDFGKKFKFGTDFLNPFKGIEEIDAKKYITPAIKKVTASFTDELRNIKQQSNKINNALRAEGKKWYKGFSMWALGVMFFGMMIQRAFTNIAVSGIKTFKDIAGSTSVLTQGLAKLEAGWTFLKFSVGNAIATALLPLIPKIMEIVMAIGEWINANPELTASIIKWGLIIGFVLFMLGSLWLGIKSLIQMFAELAIVLQSPIFWSIIIGILAVIALFYVWESAALTVVEKIGLTLAILGAAVAGVALLFGLWPIAAYAAMAAIIGLAIYSMPKVADAGELAGARLKKAWAEDTIAWMKELERRNSAFTVFLQAMFDGLPSWFKKLIGATAGPKYSAMLYFNTEELEAEIRDADKVIQRLEKGTDELKSPVDDYINTVKTEQDKLNLGLGSILGIKPDSTDLSAPTAQDNLDKLDEIKNLQTTMVSSNTYMSELTQEIANNTAALSAATGLNLTAPPPQNNITVENNFVISGTNTTEIANEVAAMIQQNLTQYTAPTP